MEQVITADGFAADERGGLEFFEVGEGSADSADDEQLEFLKSVDAILLGATTYRMFADFWPTADPVAEPVTEPSDRLPSTCYPAPSMQRRGATSRSRSSDLTQFRPCAP